MTNNANHFIGPLRQINNRAVKVYVGLIKVGVEGKSKWKIEDRNGKVHSIITHNVNYIPKDPICILLSQQWS